MKNALTISEYSSAWNFVFEQPSRAMYLELDKVISRVKGLTGSQLPLVWDEILLLAAESFDTVGE